MRDKIIHKILILLLVLSFCANISLSQSFLLKTYAQENEVQEESEKQEEKEVETLKPTEVPQPKKKRPPKTYEPPKKEQPPTENFEELPQVLGEIRTFIQPTVLGASRIITGDENQTIFWGITLLLSSFCFRIMYRKRKSK